MAVADEPEHGPGCDSPALEALLTRAAPMLVIGTRADGHIVYASAAAREVVGFEPEELVGSSILDYLHAEDVDRAIVTLTWRDADGRAPVGATTFRARHKTCGYVDVEASGGQLVYDGEEHLVVYVRPAARQSVAEELLEIVVRGSSRIDSLTAALGAIAWAEHGSQVAVAWPDADGMQQVNTGLPEGLAGFDTAGEDNPWGECISTRCPVRRSLAGLPEGTASLAKSVGLTELWVQPVLWSEDEAPALVTIWTQGGVSLPELHGYGMRMACNFVELVLRFTARTRLQEELATHDALTGLVNRRAFLDRVAQTVAGGVILYCDLDRFKPVNDELGHAVGDRLLRGVADRLVDCVRGTDIVARLGGDEFAILCDKAWPESAMMIANRIIEAFAEPFSLDDLDIKVGITIGVAHGTGTLTEEVIERADRALRTAKASHRTAVLADWDAPDR